MVCHYFSGWATLKELDAHIEVSAEEARLDDRVLDAELPDLVRHRERVALDRELRRPVDEAVLKPDARDRADAEDAARPVLSHHRQFELPAWAASRASALE